MIYTTQILQRVAMQTVARRSENLFRRFYRLLTRETARGELGDTGPLVTTYEGIMSVNQGLSQLIANRIEGMEVDQLIHEIVRPRPGTSNGIFVDYVQKQPAGTVGPLTLSGKYVPQPLAIKDGQVALSERLKNALGTAKRAREQFLQTSWREAGKRAGGETGIGCPLGFTKKGADPKSGIQSIAEAYEDIFRKVVKARETVR